MKLFKLFLILLIFSSLFSCGGGQGNISSNFNNVKNSELSITLSDGTKLVLTETNNSTNIPIKVKEEDPIKILGKDKNLKYLTKGFKLIYIPENKKSLSNSIFNIKIYLNKKVRDWNKVKLYLLENNTLIPMYFSFHFENNTKSVLSFSIPEPFLTEHEPEFFLIGNNYLEDPFLKIKTAQGTFVKGKMYPELPVNIENGFFIEKVNSKNNIILEYNCPGNNKGTVYEAYNEGDWKFFKIPLKKNYGFCDIKAFIPLIKGINIFKILVYESRVPVDRSQDVYQYKDLLEKYAPIVELGYLNNKYLPDNVYQALEGWYGCYDREKYLPLTLESLDVFVNGSTSELSSVCFDPLKEKTSANLYIGGAHYLEPTRLQYLYTIQNLNYIISLRDKNFISDPTNFYTITNRNNKKDLAKYLIRPLRKTAIYATAYEDKQRRVIYLQYWFYYIYDPKTPNAYIPKIFAQHTGDAERVTVVLNATTKKPIYVFFAHHNDDQKFSYINLYKLKNFRSFFPDTFDNLIDFTWNEKGFGDSKNGIGGAIVLWNKVEKEGNHPIVYVALGSHGIYPRRGIYRLQDPHFHEFLPKQTTVVEFAGGNDTERINYSNKLHIVPRLGFISEASPYSFLYFSGSSYQIGRLLAGFFQRDVKFFSQTNAYIFPEKKDGCLITNYNEYCRDVNITKYLFPNDNIIDNVKFSFNKNQIIINGTLNPNITPDLYFMPEDNYQLKIKWEENQNDWQTIRYYTKEQLEELAKSSAENQDLRFFQISHYYDIPGNHTITIRFETPTGAYVEKKLHIEIPNTYLTNTTSSTKDILVLTLDKENLSDQEKAVIDTLKQWGYNPITVDEENINLLDPTRYPIAVMRTASEPTVYKFHLNKIKSYLENGGIILTQYYGEYLWSYFNASSVEEGRCWCPVVHDAYYYVDLINATDPLALALTKNFPIWNPPDPPPKEEQLFWQVTPGTYDCVDILDKEHIVHIWLLKTTYGWPYQPTDSQYCLSWGKCTGEYTVYDWHMMIYYPLGKGFLAYSNLISFGKIPSCNGDAYKIGPLGKQLFSNLVNYAYNHTSVSSSSTTQQLLFEDRFDTLDNWYLVVYNSAGGSENDPPPKLDFSMGNPSPSFDPNGDSWCGNGAYSKQVFDYSKGLIIEWDMYVADARNVGCWVSGQGGLADRLPNLSNRRSDGVYIDDNLCDPTYLAGISLHPVGPDCWAEPQYQGLTRLRFWITAEDGQVDDFEVDGGWADSLLNGWHTYKIYIRPDGYVEFYIDGSRKWISTKKIDNTKGELPVVIGNRDLYGPVRIDNVKVYTVY